MEFTAKIQNGVIIPNERVLYIEEISKLEDHEVSVTIHKLKKRSNPQNRYYWGVVVYMIKSRLDDLGYVHSDLEGEAMPRKLTRNDVHNFLKEQFNRYDVVNPETGNVIGTSSRTTKKLSTIEFSQYVEHIIRWAAESLDLEIPDPTLS